MFKVGEMMIAGEMREVRLDLFTSTFEVLNTRNEEIRVYDWEVEEGKFSSVQEGLDKRWAMQEEEFAFLTQFPM